LVIALTPPARDGLAELRGEIRDVPQREALMLLWEDRQGRRRLDACDGVLLAGHGAEAPWLPGRWGPGVFPTGLELPHLERWFAYAFTMIDALADRGDIPPDSEQGHPMAPQPRELVAQAHRIVRHLGLPNPPIEWRGPMTRMGCRAELEDVFSFLRRNLSAAPPAGAAGAGKAPTGRRGRPADRDAAEDQRIADAWATGHYRDYAELARHFQRTERQVKLAIDAHRKRRKRARAVD
jgi:hypothetical protein